MNNIISQIFSVVLLLFLSTAGVSKADIQVLNEERPAGYVYSDALLREATNVAALRWARLGKVPTCGKPQVWLYTETDGRAVARGSDYYCRIWYHQDWRDREWKIYTDRKEPVFLRRQVLENICLISIHEYGHTLGLPHIPRTVMDEDLNSPMPKICIRWAKRKLRR